MNIMRRAILALVLIAGITPAIAQVPPPVPALPDTERRTTYSISASTCACNVNFALYGDSTDSTNWIEVWVNGVRMAQAGNWTLSSVTGTIGSIPLPITNAVLTFTAPQTGTIQIVGARRPRRTSQFNEGSGVPTRSFNVVLSDLTAQNRELWDKTNDVTGRALMSQPGNTLSMLPLPSACAGKFLGFDATGLIPTCISSSPGLGTVVGPGTTVTGHFATWANTIGTVLADAGTPAPIATSGSASDLSSGTIPLGRFPAGILTNTRLAKTAVYAAVSADCGSTIALGGSSFYILTVNAASGYGATCAFVVINEDTTRGKILAVNGYSNFILWPQQTAIVYNDANVWQISKPAHWLLSATTTFNVDPINGNDNNDGLATGTGAAWQTCQGAVNNVSNNVDLGQFNATIKLADGTYGPCLIGSPWYGNGNVTINGNAVTPANVVIDGAAGNFAVQAQNLGRVIVTNLKVQNAGILLGSALNSGWVQFSNVVFGNCVSAGQQIYSSRQSYIEATGAYTIASSTSCGYHINVTHQGNLRAAQANTGATLGNITANLTYSQQFAFVDSGGDITITGYATPYNLNANTVTTQRYFAGSNGILQDLIGPTAWPGTTAGIAVGGGIVNAGLHDAVSGVNTCGTSPAINGNSTDYSGSVTTGTGNPTACTVTFASAFAQNPKCRVTSSNLGNTPSFNFSANTTQIGIGWTGTLGSSTVITWQCDGS